MFQVQALYRDWRWLRFLFALLMMLAVVVLLMMRTAFAATAVAQMAVAPAAGPSVVDLTWVWGIVTAIAVALLKLLQKQLLAELQTHTSIAKNSAMLADFNNFVALAARFALDELSSVESHNMTLTVKSTAVGNGIRTAGAQLQAAASALGYTPDVIANAVSGEVAKALIPTASVTPAAPVPAAPVPAAGT